MYFNCRKYREGYVVGNNMDMDMREEDDERESAGSSI